MLNIVLPSSLDQDFITDVDQRMWPSPNDPGHAPSLVGGRYTGDGTVIWGGDSPTRNENGKSSRVTLYALRKAYLYSDTTATNDRYQLVPERLHLHETGMVSRFGEPTSEIAEDHEKIETSFEDADVSIGEVFNIDLRYKHIPEGNP